MAVADRCLGPGQFLGRSIDCFFYWETLDELGVSPADRTRSLLLRLGRRGFLIGYSFGQTEGIHGWLNPGETQELAELLFGLDLPEYEYSFAVMENFKTPGNLLEDRVPGANFQVMAYDLAGIPFEQLSLSFVRTVCRLAQREGKGVLWGNDILAFLKDSSLTAFE